MERNRPRVIEAEICGSLSMHVVDGVPLSEISRTMFQPTRQDIRKPKVSQPLSWSGLSGIYNWPVGASIAETVTEEKIQVAIHPEYPEQTIAICSTLTEEGPKSCARMCVDFKDLNKACPKDGYPLPKIDWKMESLCGCPFKCFLDAYKGYHQIKMAKEDEEKTAFITSQGIFCYSKMPFGLKNVGATYQRLVDKAFQKQIGRNLEAYVDDLVLKKLQEQELSRDVKKIQKPQKI
ncbi:reverse transcriptase domain-containing protein [Tanacetum coccineum]